MDATVFLPARVPVSLGEGERGLGSVYPTLTPVPLRLGEGGRGEVRLLDLGQVDAGAEVSAVSRKIIRLPNALNVGASDWKRMPFALRSAISASMSFTT